MRQARFRVGTRWTPRLVGVRFRMDAWQVLNVLVYRLGSPIYEIYPSPLLAHTHARIMRRYLKALTEWESRVRTVNLS